MMNDDDDDDDGYEPSLPRQSFNSLGPRFPSSRVSDPRFGFRGKKIIERGPEPPRDTTPPLGASVWTAGRFVRRWRAAKARTGQRACR